MLGADQQENGCAGMLDTEKKKKETRIHTWNKMSFQSFSVTHQTTVKSFFEESAGNISSLTASCTHLLLDFHGFTRLMTNRHYDRGGG